MQILCGGRRYSHSDFLNVAQKQIGEISFLTPCVSKILLFRVQYNLFHIQPVFSATLEGNASNIYRTFLPDVDISCCTSFFDSLSDFVPVRQATNLRLFFTLHFPPKNTSCVLCQPPGACGLTIFVYSIPWEPVLAMGIVLSGLLKY